MRIFTLGTIRQACSDYPNAASSLRAWHSAMQHNAFAGFADLRQHFAGKVDKVDHCYIFNINGNHLRLIAKIVFDRRFVFIKKILTHANYDKEPWYDHCRCTEP